MSAAAAVMLAAACSHNVDVRTTAAPDANFSALRTFRILPAPERRPNAPRLAEWDPMLNNSITNREVRNELENDMQQKGYRRDAQNPDVLVAFYVGEREKFDTTWWEPGPYRYGYRGFRDRWAWPYYGYPAPAYGEIRESTRGTVVVDVIDARNRELLWRGQGTATVSDDPNHYASELRKTVDAVVKKLPGSG